MNNDKDQSGPAGNDEPSGGEHTNGCNTVLIIVTENPKDGAVLRSPDFGKRLQEWRENPDSAKVRFVMMLGMVRPEPRFHKDANRRFFAYDSSFYPGNAVEDRDTSQQFWEGLIDIEPASMDFIKSGPEIWKTLDIKVPDAQIKRLMRMEYVDAATSEAVQAALLSAFNTARDPIDMDTAAFVVATFIHSHPLFKNFVSDEVFSKPYGEATVYGLLKRPGCGAAPGHGQNHDHPSDGYIDDPDVSEVAPQADSDDPQSEHDDEDARLGRRS
jgi:hypothetical protein